MMDTPGDDAQALTPDAPMPDTGATPPQLEQAPVREPTTARQRANDLGGLRVVIVMWCFWLLGAWAVAWLSDTSVPRVRWMLFAGSFGLMLVWPAYRLSEQVPPGELGRGALQALLDWLAMASVYQAVIWSLHLIAGWPMTRGLWLDAAVLAWSLLTALIVGAARLWPGGLARLVGMALCIALVFAEPVAIWLSIVDGGAGWPMRISPVQALWELTGAPGEQAAAPWDVQIMQVGLVAVAGWLALGGWALVDRLIRRRLSSRDQALSPDA